MSPSSISIAVQINDIESPIVKLEPSAGAVIVTTGGEPLVTVTLIESDPGFPSESVTLAVIV